MQMKNILMALFGLIVFAVACTDPELDPLQFDKIKKGSLITLRGDAVDILNDPANRGAMDTFNLSGSAANYSLDFDTDFLAEDITTIAEVQVYASATAGGARQRVGTVAGSAFDLTKGDGKYPRATVKIPFTEILNKLGKNIGDFTANQYIYISCDLTLTNGETVPASSFTNLSLSESLLFYPAHNLLMIAKP
jgi:hypothetical protein